MSAATLFSRLNITDSCCASTWPNIWLLWRRIARNILMWLIAGSRINKTMDIICRMYRTVSERKAWSKIVTKSQTVAVMLAALFVPVEKGKCVIFRHLNSSIVFPNVTKYTNKGNNTIYLTLPFSV